MQMKPRWVAVMLWPIQKLSTVEVLNFQIALPPEGGNSGQMCLCSLADVTKFVLPDLPTSSNIGHRLLTELQFYCVWILIKEPRRWKYMREGNAMLY